MDRDRYSFLAHASHDILNPVSSAALDIAIERIAPARGQRALDIGCGKAELLLRLAARHDVEGLGVERSSLMAGAAIARAAARSLSPRVTIRHADAREVVPTLPPASFDITACVGSTHALGDLAASLDEMIRVTRPGGALLIGEGYWKGPPAQEYLSALEAVESDLRTHQGNIDLAGTRGLDTAWSACASELDWDEYEAAYARNIEDFARSHPSDPDVPAMLERSRAWTRTYRFHGRETLGFALYLFRKPD